MCCICLLLKGPEHSVCLCWSRALTLCLQTTSWLTKASSLSVCMPLSKPLSFYLFPVNFHFSLKTWYQLQFWQICSCTWCINAKFSHQECIILSVLLFCPLSVHWTWIRCFFFLFNCFTISSELNMHIWRPFFSLHHVCFVVLWFLKLLALIGVLRAVLAVVAQPNYSLMLWIFLWASFVFPHISVLA